MPSILVDGERYDLAQEECDAFFPPVPASSADVNAEHDRRALAGRVFTVEGYGDIALEGSDRAQTVLLALKDSARDLIDVGISSPLLRFTDRDNVTHTLTPRWTVELVNAGKAYMQALHDAKIALKAMDPIPADYADDSRWP